MNCHSNLLEKPRLLLPGHIVKYRPFKKILSCFKKTFLHLLTYLKYRKIGFKGPGRAAVLFGFLSCRSPCGKSPRVPPNHLSRAGTTYSTTTTLFQTNNLQLPDPFTKVHTMSHSQEAGQRPALRTSNNLILQYCRILVDCRP